MSRRKKMSRNQRQKYIVELLQSHKGPFTGQKIAEKTGVSRQVIVQDISILKAQNHPIMATSQGYLYVDHEPNVIRHMIAVHHSPEETMKELYIIVDHGVTVKNVIVEHPVYGELMASVMVSNRKEVDQFLEMIEKTNASFLSELTEGVHLHELVAPTMEQIQAACKELKTEDILLEDQ